MTRDERSKFDLLLEAIKYYAEEIRSLDTKAEVLVIFYTTIFAVLVNKIFNLTTQIYLSSQELKIAAFTIGLIVGTVSGFALVS